MVEMLMDEIKEVELNILIYIDKICRDNNIDYSLCGGTLLGAIRHKGFIPWDDDIDIFIKREQYEKFVELVANDTNCRYSILDYRKCSDYNYLFSKVIDTDTILVEDHNKPIVNNGVCVDVFPIDNLGKNYKDAVKNLKKVKFKRFLGVAYNWSHFYINKNRSIIRQIPRFVFFILSRFQNIKKNYNKIEERFSNVKLSSYSGCVCGSYEEKEIMKNEVFDSFIDVDFEEYKFKAIKLYNEYLSRIYGDYMKLPPEEKRVPHHTFNAYWRDKK